jgi:hypothetical protein
MRGLEVRILGGLLVFLCVVGFWIFETRTHADGTYPLTVQVRSISNSSIRAVSCEAFWTAGAAATSYEHLLPPTSRFSGKADPYTGKRLTVEIEFSQYMGQKLIGDWYVKRDSQCTALLVIADFADGERAGKIVEIPNRKVARSIIVDLP